MNGSGTVLVYRDEDHPRPPPPPLPTAPPIHVALLDRRNNSSEARGGIVYKVYVRGLFSLFCMAILFNVAYWIPQYVWPYRHADRAILALGGGLLMLFSRLVFLSTVGVGHNVVNYARFFRGLFVVATIALPIVSLSSASRNYALSSLARRTTSVDVRDLRRTRSRRPSYLGTYRVLRGVVDRGTAYGSSGRACKGGDHDRDCFTVWDTAHVVPVLSCDHSRGDDDGDDFDVASCFEFPLVVFDFDNFFRPTDAPNASRVLHEARCDNDDDEEYGSADVGDADDLTAGPTAVCGYRGALSPYKYVALERSCTDMVRSMTVEYHLKEASSSSIMDTCMNEYLSAGTRTEESKKLRRMATLQFIGANVLFFAIIVCVLVTRCILR